MYFIGHWVFFYSGILLTDSTGRDSMAALCESVITIKKKTIHRSCRMALDSATRIRTWKCRNQNPVPYHLAIALYLKKSGNVGKRIRTPDLLVRSQTLYPAELCPHNI